MPLGLAVLTVILGAAWDAGAEKIWTASGSGLWSEGTNWSGHVPPDITSFIRITNANTKTITIDASTSANNLTVQKISISGPPGTTNTLWLSSAGNANPLVLQTGLELLDGGAIRVTGSTLQTLLTNDHVNIDGQLALESGLVDFGDTTVTARVGRVTSGVMTILGGTVSAGAVTVGGLTNSSGFVDMQGGNFSVSSIFSVGRSLGTTGVVSITGGQISVPNDDTRVGDEGWGQMTISNATASLNNLQVGRDNTGTLTIASGGIVQVALDTVLGKFAGSTATVSVAGGQLLAPGQKISVSRGGNALLSVSSGTLSTANLVVAGDTTNSSPIAGQVNVSGGNVLLSSNLVVGTIGNANGQVTISGGQLAVTNSSQSGLVSPMNGTVLLQGGGLSVDRLVVTNPAGNITFQGGILDSRGTTVSNGSPFVVGDGVSPAVFRLNGGTHVFADGLVIAPNATLTGCGTIIGSVVNRGTISTNCGAGASSPAVATPPQSQTVVQGGNVAFTVSATGTAPLFYQWRLEGTNLPGATANPYQKASVQPGDAGNYTVVVTNSAGAVTSSPPALLTVLVRPSISAPPQSQTAIQGGNVAFTISATGTAPLFYQWRLEGTNLPGATANLYQKASVQPGDAGNYTVVVTNSAGAVTSSPPALLTVLVPPSISAPPQSQTVVQGTNVTFTVSATGTAPLYYQWRLEGTNLPGATTDPYQKSGVQPGDAGNYTVVVTNSAGAVTSAPPAMLTVIRPSGQLTIALETHNATSNIVSFLSVPGSVYTLQYKDLLADPNWTNITPSTNGTGALIRLLDPTATGGSRLYRVLIQ